MKKNDFPPTAAMYIVYTRIFRSTKSLKLMRANSRVMVGMTTITMGHQNSTGQQLRMMLLWLAWQLLLLDTKIELYSNSSEQ